MWATDGPGESPPADLARIPDAVPLVEPLRSGPMRAVPVNGQRYQPMTEDLPLVERGLATWYGRKFHGRPTASGERYDMYAMTAAHPTMPLPSYARVRNLANAREVIVRINDRGPFHRGRVIDLSYTAAHKLDLLRGAGMVEVERITQDEIRDGRWRQEPAPESPPLRPEPSELLPVPVPVPAQVASALPLAATSMRESQGLAVAGIGGCRCRWSGSASRPCPPPPGRRPQPDRDTGSSSAPFASALVRRSSSAGSEADLGWLAAVAGGASTTPGCTACRPDRLPIWTRRPRWRSGCARSCNSCR